MTKASLYQQWGHPRFDYIEAGSVEEVCTLLSKNKSTAKVLAGGTDLLLSMRKGKIFPAYVINLKNIPDLDHISYSDGVLRVGALVTLDDIETSAIIKSAFPLIVTSAHQIGTQQIRNVATIGGNLCNASPSADMAPALIGLGAKVKLRHVQGERTMALESFFIGPGETALQDNEMLVEIEVPNPPPYTAGVYLKLPARTAIDLAVVGVAAVVTLDEKHNRAIYAKLVLGAVAPTPLRALEAEKIVLGGKISDELVEKAAKMASEEAKPITDVRGSAGYRKEMVRVLTNRAMKLALTSAQTGQVMSTRVKSNG